MPMTRSLMFDLDNTLYSENSGLEMGVLARINDFVAEYLGLPLEQAAATRREGTRRYGTTLEWLMREKDFSDFDRYFAFVHPESETDCLSDDPGLRDFLDALPQPKIILTNAPMEHAKRVLRVLGVEDRFKAIYDIRFNGLVGKPHGASYLRALESSGFDIADTLFVDDHPSYVRGYADLGGRSILVDEGDRFASLGFERIRKLSELASIL